MRINAHKPIYETCGELPRIRIATAADAPFVSNIVGVDASEFMKRATTILTDHGGFFLEPITSAVFEAHMFFSESGRGAECVRAARDGLRYAFREMGAAVVFGRIPIDDRPARLITRIIGFKADGVRPREPGGPLVEWFQMRSEECPQQ